MRYKSPSLAVDGVVFKDNTVLLVKRKNDPFKGFWALPGGFVEYGEKVEDSVVREVSEETGLETRVNRLVGVYSDPSRDPRGHIVSVVFLLNIVGGVLKSGDDAAEARFFKVDDLPRLSFDHSIIIKDASRMVK